MPVRASYSKKKDKCGKISNADFNVGDELVTAKRNSVLHAVSSRISSEQGGKNSMKFKSMRALLLKFAAVPCNRSPRT